MRVSELVLDTRMFGDDWALPNELPAQSFERFTEAGGNVIDTSDE